MLRLCACQATLRIIEPTCRQIVTAALRYRAAAAPVLSNWHNLLDYLHADFEFRPVEVVRALFLDVSFRLITDEIVATGSIDRCSVRAREIIVRTLELGAAGIILVHNYSSRDPTPMPT